MDNNKNPIRLAKIIKRFLASEGFFPINDPIFIQWKNEEPNIIETHEEFLRDFGYGQYHINFGEVQVMIDDEEFTINPIDMTMSYRKDDGWFKYRIFTETEEIIISENTSEEADERAEIIMNKIMGLMGDLSEMWEAAQVVKKTTQALRMI